MQNYGSLLAVADVSLRVREGECFGLLGVNGAGKTSTFQMLTGEQLIDGGMAHMNTTAVGYCPQFDAVVGKFTGGQLVRLMGRIRGVPEASVHNVAARVIDAVGITKYAHQAVHTYSGGTKRRLSLALALVGGTKVLLLDEPTTGVDPAARRALWTVLARLKSAGTGVV
jgi:ABC-type multidrug transport system ATPase subunit